MSEGFVSLVSVLRGDADLIATAVTAAGASEETVAPDASGTDDASSVLGEIARLRLAMHDAFENAIGRLLAALAEEVLARELALRPVDVDALVARALDAFANHEPLEIAVSAVDAGAVSARSSLAVRIDETLLPGDLVVRVRDGAFESSFAFRAAQVLARSQVR